MERTRLAVHQQTFLNLLRQNGRGVTKVYLPRTDNLNDSVAPDTIGGSDVVCVK